MYIKLVLFSYFVTQIFANNATHDGYYFCFQLQYPYEDNGELLFRNIFAKLNSIIVENQQISKKLNDVEKRLDKSNSDNVSSDWTVIQRRQDGSIDFNRNWSEYKKGFGNPNGEFFIGLEKLHLLTSNGPPKELWIVLKDFDNETRYAIYDNFVVGNETEKYALKELGLYRGTAGDDLYYHKGLAFSTKDDSSCAQRFKGAWWFKNGTIIQCYSSNLNGLYLRGINPTGGVVWGGFHAWNYSLKFAEMLIRSAK